jgi:hypothetical protein
MGTTSFSARRAFQAAPASIQRRASASAYSRCFNTAGAALRWIGYAARAPASRRDQ